jgi:hypothetical protein
MIVLWNIARFLIADCVIKNLESSNGKWNLAIRRARNSLGIGRATAPAAENGAPT